MIKWVFCTVDTAPEVNSLLESNLFSESNTTDLIRDFFYIEINLTLKTFRLSNTMRGRGSYLDTTSSDWKPVLLEYLTASKVRTPLYPFRPKGETLKYLEQLRKARGINKSNVVAYVVNEYRKQNPSTE